MASTATEERALVKSSIFMNLYNFLVELSYADSNKVAKLYSSILDSLSNVICTENT
jgi:hypothetical protein